ncbi:MAG: sodium:proton antiporter [Cyanobacteria bacterium CRU_2_1]|nr:sodium:proton antiporter [Cyanobacteria bacterium RU_5_0]NJR59712.1 sodium:proton antiporter [Cyanobacteria bacterium CRU_2_1]
MSVYILDLLIIGLLLISVTLGSGWIARLPLSYAMIYLIVGIILGPYGFNLIQLQPGEQFLERLTEFVVLISLFSCGLKMNRPLNLWAWNSTIRLIGLLMPITIVAIAAIAHGFLGFSWGEGILLGAILAPTDPVLASEVQLTHPDDHDELRFGLTSEGGINDAAAFPFVYFGLYWLKNDRWQDWFINWVAVDLIWATIAGFTVGILVPRAITWLDKRVQRSRQVDELMEDFVALGMILVTYAIAEILNGYGFLAVFVAGIINQRSYRDPEKQLSQLNFTERTEKLLEIGTILLLGTILQGEPLGLFALPGLFIAGILTFVIRPIGAWISTIGANYHPARRWLFGWFGIRGVGSLYYLSYALGNGLEGEIAAQIAWIAVIVILCSIVLHGVSATPLMKWYERHIEARRGRLEQALQQNDR